MKKLIFTIYLSIFTLDLIAQLPPKISNDDLFGKESFYYKQIPKTKVKGVLVLIPGLGEHPYAVSAQTTILQEAQKNEIAVMIVNLTPNNESLPIDDESISKLEKMIKYFYEKEKLPESIRLFIGGFSIGGTTALKFYSEKDKMIKIDKVFAIDPPLDMIRLRKSLAKGVDKSVIKKLDSLNKDLNYPENGLKNLSVYNPDFTYKMLPNFTETSLRIYCEPDIMWWVKNRNMDLSDMNVTDCAGYINKILQKGADQKAELILTQNKGIRNGNRIHPHSWSIAEPKELINWLLNY